MGALDNGDWLRSFLATQLGNANNQMMPVGQAYPTYLNYANPLFGNAQNGMNQASSMLYGSQGIGGLADLLSQYGQNLPGMFSGMVGNTQGSQNINQSFLDSIFGNQSNTSSAFNNMNQGSGQTNDVYNTIMSQLYGGNPYNQGMGDIGNTLLGSLGQNPINSSMSNIGNYMMQNGGWGSQLSGGIGPMMGLINNQGQTNAANSQMGQGSNWLGQGGQNTGTGMNTLQQAMQMMGMGGQMGQSLMGSGQDMMTAGNSWTNPMLQQGSQAGMGIVGNQGMTPFLSQGMGGVNQVAQQGGAMPQLSALQSQLFPQIQQGSYGQTQPGFDFANQLMAGDGLSPYTTQGANLALQYAQGGGPSATAGLTMPNFSFGGGASFTPGGDVSAGAVDSGYTQSLDDTIAQAKKILSDNPLIPMNQAISMARNQAATATQQQNEAMMSKALARGGGPGATVANGLQNRGMAEMADAGSQAEAQAMQSAMMQQQGLQLQKYGIGADLDKAMEQVAQGRNAASSQLQGQVASANAGIHAANAGASAQVASSNNSLAAAMANAQAQLYGQLAGINAQKQMTGLNDLGTFSGQANNQMLAGLNAVPGLQTSANQRYGQDLGSFMQATGTQSDRQMQSLGLMPSFSNAQTGMLNAGFNGLTGLQNTQNQGQLGRINAGENLTGTGAGLYSNSANGMNSTGNNMGSIGLGQGQIGSNMFNAGAGNATSNLQNSLGLLPNYSNAATNNFNAGNSAATNGQQGQLGFSQLGSQLSQNNVGNTSNLLQQLLSATGQQNNYTTGMGQLGNSLWNTQNNGLSSAFGNQLNLNNFGLSGFNSLNGAINSNFGNQQGSNALLAQLIANNQNTIGGLAGGAMNYLQGAQNGYFGINPSSGNQQTFLAQYALNAQKAAMAMAGGG